QFLQLLPDLRLEVAEYATNGEFHFIRWIGRATGAKGPVELSGIDRIRVQDGLFTENFVVFDTARFAALVGGEDRRLLTQSKAQRRRIPMAEVMTQDLTATVDTYFAMWNEEETTNRARHIEAASA